VLVDSGVPLAGGGRLRVQLPDDPVVLQEDLGALLKLLGRRVVSVVQSHKVHEGRAVHHLVEGLRASGNDTGQNSESE